jgi:GNAT superfamily N-acetyltransferase
MISQAAFRRRRKKVVREINMKEQTKITIRKAMLEDAEEWAEFHISSWRSAYKGIVSDEYLAGLSTQERAAAFSRNLTGLTGYEFFCAVCGDKIIGTLFIGKSHDDDKPEAGEICAVYLLEEFWDKGIGLELMDFGIDKLRQNGHGEAILWVLEENARARRFYEKYGFSADGAKKEIGRGAEYIFFYDASNVTYSSHVNRFKIKYYKDVNSLPA